MNSKAPEYGAITRPLDTPPFENSTNHDDDSWQGSFQHKYPYDDDDDSQYSGRKKTIVIVNAIILSLLASLILCYSSGPSLFMLSSSNKNYVDHDNDPLFFEQLVDHFDDDNDATWSNRYYKSTKYYDGPGSPIFLIVGGEGALNGGFLYPFVTERLCKSFKAAVLQVEHRFYGPYQPVTNATNEQLLNLLTPHQAMADMVRLVRYIRDYEFKCSPDRSSSDYCPIIVVGASYPGFLSAMFRLVYPDFVDMAYASSAPLLMYAQETAPKGKQDVYYDIVTRSAEKTSEGCAFAVKQTLFGLGDAVMEAPTLHDAANKIGICTDNLPIDGTTSQLRDAVVSMMQMSFASNNMANYPPGRDTGLAKLCQLFKNKEMTSVEKLGAFFEKKMLEEQMDEDGCDLISVHCDEEIELRKAEEKKRLVSSSPTSCYPMDSDLTGDGDDDNDNDGKMWNFQTCTHLIFLLGFSEYSMFPQKEATYEDLTKECRAEFGDDITPNPYELVKKWKFNDLVKAGASHILFTNGLQDMWSGGSILEDLSENILAINFENGAHHSDLTHEGPSDKDTDDIKEGFILIENILKEWLNEIREKQQYQ